MINLIQKIFRTEKWWGKTIFMFLIYIFFWFTFYGSWFLMPSKWFNNNTDISGRLFLIFLFIIVPIISFFIPYFFRRIFKINKIFLYILHVFLILLSIWVFIQIGISIALKNFQIG